MITVCQVVTGRYWSPLSAPGDRDSDLMVTWRHGERRRMGQVRESCYSDHNDDHMETLRHEDHNDNHLETLRYEGVRIYCLRMGALCLPVVCFMRFWERAYN